MAKENIPQVLSRHHHIIILAATERYETKQNKTKNKHIKKWRDRNNTEKFEDKKQTKKKKHRQK